MKVLHAITVFTFIRNICVLAQPFKLPALPYASDALEPHIDKATMEIHHGKHHAAYVAGLNAAMPKADHGGKPEVALATMQKTAVAAGDARRNHGGGHYNHALFWVNLGPAGKGGEPSALLQKAIDKAFGNLQGFKDTFTKAATTRFGSGWAWLGVTTTGDLAVTSTANQDNPLMDGLPYDHVSMVPILGLDVWEHAYYLKYQNRRPDYITAFWNVVNWKKVSRNFEKYASKGEAVPPTPTGGDHAVEL